MTYITCKSCFFFAMSSQKYFKCNCKDKIAAKNEKKNETFNKYCHCAKRVCPGLKQAKSGMFCHGNLYYVAN